MAETEPAAPRTRSPAQQTAIVGLLVAVLYLCASIVWRVLIECGGGVVIMGLLLASGADPAALTEEDINAMMRADLIAALSGIQLAGLVALAVVAALAVRYELARSFAIRGAHPAALVAGLIGGLTVGWFPGWVAENLAELAPWLSLGNLEAISKAIGDSPLFGKLLMLIAVCVLAPIGEELVFRGFLWDAFERALPGWLVWIATSCLFAIYHVDPVHVISVLFTGLFLGWLRWVSGSIWPSILAHFGNNALGAGAVLVLGVDSDLSTPWWAAILSIVATLALAGLGWLGRKRSA